MIWDKDDIERLKNEIVENIINVEKELGMISDTKNQVHDDVPISKVNEVGDTQMKYVKHEHGVEDENMQNDTLFKSRRECCRRRHSSSRRKYW